jgi:hypothetical protein
LGLSLGVVFGLTIFDNLALGMGIGVAIGISFGVAFESSNSKKDD